MGSCPAADKYYTGLLIKIREFYERIEDEDFHIKFVEFEDLGDFNLFASKESCSIRVRSLQVSVVVSMAECICADGTILPPLGIFKGKNVLQSWIPDNVLDKWFFSAIKKGWISNLHGLEWLKRVFEPTIRTKANG